VRWAPQTAGRRRLTPSQLISDGPVGNKRSSEVIKKQRNRICLLLFYKQSHKFNQYLVSNNSSKITYNTTNIHNSSFHMKHTIKFTKCSSVHKLKHKFTSSQVHNSTSSFTIPQVHKSIVREKHKETSYSNGGG
jgi:hypothetical protein